MELVARLLGDFEYLLTGGRAIMTIALALPASDERQRRAIVRRSFRRRARRRFDRWPTLDDRALCRRLTLEGFENLHAARAARPAVLAVSSALGEPRLAGRVWRLYGGDAQAALPLLPGDSGTAAATTTCAVTFLGQPLRCPIGPADAALRAGAALLPIFGLFAPGARYRVCCAPPILPENEDAAALTHRTLAAIEAAVRAEPEAWPWMCALHPIVSPLATDPANMPR